MHIVDTDDTEFVCGRGATLFCIRPDCDDPLTEEKEKGGSEVEAFLFGKVESSERCYESG